MTSGDFRALMAELAGVTAERDALREVVARERSSFDEYVLRVGVLEARLHEERASWAKLEEAQDTQIRALTKAIQRARDAQLWWGAIGLGVGYGVAR